MVAGSVLRVLCVLVVCFTLPILADFLLHTRRAIDILSGMSTKQATAMIKLTHAAHLVAIPFVVATVMHTHSGLGFDSPALGWAVAVGLAVSVWIGWWHVFAPSAGWLVRVLAIAGLMMLAPVEGYLMYQYEGDIKDPAYVVELANYKQAQADYAAMLQSWERDQASADKQRGVIELQIKEIVDNGKLTTRRSEIERLKKDLANLDAISTKPPAFNISPPVERVIINNPWLLKTGITLGVIPVIYMLLHLFGFYRKPETGHTKNSDWSHSNALLICDSSVTNQKTLIYDDKNRLQNDIAIDVKKIMQLPVGTNFKCPACGKASIKTRAATKTCGASACKMAVKRAIDNIKPVKQKSASILRLVK